MLIIPRNVRLCIFNTDLIILDLNKDEFIIIEDGYKKDYESPLESEVLMHISENFNINPVSELSSDANRGYLDVRWMMPDFEASKVGFFKTLWMYFHLRNSVKTLKVRGLLGVEEKIRKIRFKRKHSFNFIYDENVLHEVNSWISAAFKLISCENPCIVYSFVTASLLLKKSYDAKIIVGVRTRPFFSHAWLEINGRVYGDDSDLREKLSVIMEI